MAYKYPAWQALKKVAEENNRGYNPRSKDFNSGSQLDQLSKLKSEGLLHNAGDGYTITESGRQVLAQLEANPPRPRRGRYAKVESKKETIKSDSIVDKMTPDKIDHEAVKIFISLKGFDKEAALKINSRVRELLE